MSKETTIIVLGFLVIILPKLGFPEDWRFIFFLLIGSALVVIGFLLRREALAHGTKRSVRNSFVESEPKEPMSDIRTHETHPMDAVSAEETV